MLPSNHGNKYSGPLTVILLTWGIILCAQSLRAQSYFGFGQYELYEIGISEAYCGCSLTLLANTEFSSGVTFCEDQMLYSQHNSVMTVVDTMTGMVDTIFPGVDSIHLPEGFGCLGDGLFYFLGNQSDPPPLYLFDSNAGTITNLGIPPYDPVGEIAIQDGIMYYSTLTGIVQVDPDDPPGSQLIITFPPNTVIEGLTATSWCNVLLGIDILADKLYMINLIDGTITFVCDMPNSIGRITSLLEHTPTANCENTIDLDCNNSSGAADPDYNSFPINCLSNGAPVADTDIRLFYDAVIEEMTIQIAGFVPDAPFEILVLAGATPNLTVTNSGTDMITLTNDGGAISGDFIAALQLIQYYNNASLPTPGPRTVAIQFTTAFGTVSNTAMAHILVEELPLVDVNLGADLELCQGDQFTLNAGNPGATYQWSTGASTQTIQVSNPGLYSVTVSQINHCPGQDTILLAFLPVISIGLTGNTETCDNENITLQVNLDTSIPVTMTITTSNGTVFTFTDVQSDFEITDMPGASSTYLITNVVSPEPSCILIADSMHAVTVHPTYTADVFETICEGDSILLGDTWETESGEYEIVFATQQGCDSLVIYTIELLPAESIFIDAVTCDPEASGVFISYLNNPGGCDTMVTTTVSLLATDTITVLLSSCRQTDTGTSTDTLTNADGCDSLVITIISYIPPEDTIYQYQTTCDSMLVTVIHELSTGDNGCDSLTITTVTLSPADTTYLYGVSCDTAQVGIWQQIQTGMDGCDSLIITNISPGLPDTTIAFLTSCDSSSLGTFMEHYPTTFGCDSTVITTVVYSSQDSVFIFDTTCDPNGAGNFISLYTNQFGCDSIVMQTISLLPSDVTEIHSTTCDSTAAGIFVDTLTNLNGCDSIVMVTVSLLPSDQHMLTSTTCQATEAGVFVTILQNQFGCDSVITETIALLPGDTTYLAAGSCHPEETGQKLYTAMGSDGCDSIIVEITELFPSAQLVIQPIFDYNGFDISCSGHADGGIATVITGMGPFTYLWSTSDTTAELTGLEAGNYAVTITDGNGCPTDAVITLEEPTALMIGFAVAAPDCFDQALGIIRIKATGGVPPYMYSKDGGEMQTSDEFHSLGDGIYRFEVIDANGCTAAEIISIDVPLMVSVELGPDQSVSLGDTTVINAIVNLPLDSITEIVWSGPDVDTCSSCLQQIVSPIITTAYAVSVISADGCSDRDTLTIAVTGMQQMFIPNIFSPNGDGINDLLRLNAVDGVQEVSVMEIYDRWGNLVFGFTRKAPDDPTAHWNGTFHGEPLNPGVFTYKAVILFDSGDTEVRYGDITLIR